MFYRTLFGLPLSRDAFARKLIAMAREAGQPDWQYRPAEVLLVNTGRRGFQLNLVNIYREYECAKPSDRKRLLLKYRALLTHNTQTPKLWTLAATGIYPAIRSRYAATVIEIESRTAAQPVTPVLRQPLCGDLQVALLYDFGPHMAHVIQPTAETWGAPVEEIWARALGNLRALRRPKWEPVGPGVLRLLSSVSYEETFLMVDEVRAALPYGERAVFACPNRGVLLAADGGDVESCRHLIAMARHHLTKNPWPMSGTLLQRVASSWRIFEPPAECAAAARSLRVYHLGPVYRDQKAALTRLHQQLKVNVYVGDFMVEMAHGSADNLVTCCSWARGIRALLPRTDYVILVPEPKESPAKPRFLVPWETVAGVCSAYLHKTDEDPERYAVMEFPTPEELAKLRDSPGSRVLGAPVMSTAGRG